MALDQVKIGGKVYKTGLAMFDDIKKAVKEIISSILIKTNEDSRIPNRIRVKQSDAFYNMDFVRNDANAGRIYYAFTDEDGDYCFVEGNSVSVGDNVLYEEADGSVSTLGQVVLAESFVFASKKDVDQIKESVGEDTTPMPLNIMGDEDGEPRPKMSLHDKMYMLAGMIGTKGDSQTGEESIYAEIEKNGNKLSALTNSNVLSNTPSVAIISGMTYSYVGYELHNVDGYNLPMYKWQLIVTPQVITSEIPEEYYTLYSVDAVNNAQIYTLEGNDAVVLEDVHIEECRSLGGVEKKVSELATQCAEIQSAIGYATNEIDSL